MSNRTEDAEALAGLRRRASDKLGATSRASGRRAHPAAALGVLHQMAASPTTAADALALLHELQVYQVELELQHEELRRSQTELEIALRHQSALFENAPAGYMTIDAASVICEINLAGARLLGAAHEDLIGRRLAELVAAESNDALQALIDGALSAEVSETCALHLKSSAQAGTTVHAAAAQDAAPGRFLLVLMYPPAPRC
jgi:PAS domain S-box-containing protein